MFIMLQESRTKDCNLDLISKSAKLEGNLPLTKWFDACASDNCPAISFVYCVISQLLSLDYTPYIGIKKLS